MFALNEFIRRKRLYMFGCAQNSQMANTVGDKRLNLYLLSIYFNIISDSNLLCIILCIL